MNSRTYSFNRYFIKPVVFQICGQPLFQKIMKTLFPPQLYKMFT